MKRKFTLFAIVQLFFGVIFCLSTLLFSKTYGLQPFNSHQETVYINLNEDATADQIKSMAKTESLNIAIYDKKNNEYYIFFSENVNPKSIYGVPSTMFLANDFYEKDCASTDLNKNCILELSNPDKKEEITIYSLDKLEQGENISNIILYPSPMKSKDDIKNIFLKKYPNAVFLANVSLPNDVATIIVIFFIVINILVLLSIIQTLYKQGKLFGIQKLFGKTILERSVIPLIIMMLIVVAILCVLYFVIYNWFTFDWSYIKFIVTYCLIVAFLFSIGLTYNQLKINKYSINLLIQGMIKSKILLSSYIVISIFFLLLGGFMVPTASISIRQVLGEYKRFSYYKTELELSGTIPLKQSSVSLFLQQDSTLLEKNNEIMQSVSQYLEYKNKSQVPYQDDSDSSFPIFQVNKNFVLNRIDDDFKSFDFDDESKVYLFSKNSTEQSKEIETIKYYYSGSKDYGKTVEVIEYDDNQQHEYIQDETYMEKSRIQYIDITSPIYVVNGGKEEYKDQTFTSQYAGGYYISLESEEAQQIWGEIPTLLKEIGGSDYYEEPTTIYSFQEKELKNYLFVFYATLGISIVSLVGGVFLINVCLQEYFRNKRKELVIKRIFGETFLQRYGMVFSIVTLSFGFSWIISTFIQQEWVLFNILFLIVAIIIMNIAVRREIIHLEKDAINIVIKE